MASGTLFEPNILVWRVTGGEVLLQLPGYTGVDTIMFSHDGALILSAFATREVVVWDAKSGYLIRNLLKGHLGAVACTAFVPNSSNIVSGSSDRTIRLWDLGRDDSEYIEKQLFGHSSRVSSVGFSSDSKNLVSGAGDGSVWLWDAETGSPIDGPLYVDDPIGYVSFLPGDDKLVVICEKVIKIRDIKAIEPTSDTVTLPIAPSAYSYEAHCALSLENNEIQLWDTNTGQAIGGPVAKVSDECFVADFSHDGLLFALGLEDKTVKIWEVETRKSVGDVLEGHSDPVSCLIFSPDRTLLATGSYDRTVRIWDVSTQKSIAGPLEGHKKSIQALAFSPDSTFLASGDWRNVIKLWDARTGVSISSPLVGDANNIVSLAISFDGNRLVSGTRDGTVDIWDISASARDTQFQGLIHRNISKKTLAVRSNLA
jgi:WD40 repeat protein